jgi:DNA polymerase-3 subunit epsilon
VNPGRPIPPEVTELTGITDAMVASAPPFSDLAEGIAKLIHGQPLITFNGLRFDVPLLAEEFERAGVEYHFGPVIDCDALFKQHHSRTLTDAVRIYLGETHDGAHNAEVDVKATMRVFNEMREQFPKLLELEHSTDITGILQGAADLSAYGKRPADPHGIVCWIDGRMCYTHKKVRGVPVEDDMGYAEWMLGKDFPAATKRVLRAELQRIADEWRAASGAGVASASEEDQPW